MGKVGICGSAVECSPKTGTYLLITEPEMDYLCTNSRLSYKS